MTISASNNFVLFDESNVSTFLYSMPYFDILPVLKIYNYIYYRFPVLAMHIEMPINYIA